MYCSKCGEKNTNENIFCSSCGNKMDTVSEPSKENIESQKSGQINVKNQYLFAVLGWVFCAVSILFVPILSTGAALIFGYLHREIDKTHGTIIMIAAGACGLFGSLLALSLV